jgi:hypothetical protein
MPIGCLSEQIIYEVNGLMDDIYSKYHTSAGSLNKRIKNAAKTFDRLIWQNQNAGLNNFGESKKIKIIMLLTADNPDSGQKKTYHKGVIYNIGARRGNLMIEKGYAEVI